MTRTIRQYIEKYPFMEDYLRENSLYFPNSLDLSLRELADSLDLEYLEEKLINKDLIEEDFKNYLDNMKVFLGIEDEFNLEYIEILAGYNKKGEKEKFDKIVFKKSEIISIVGPTGSGKSRLLGDIEWLAQGDTPTGRHVRVNGLDLDSSYKYGEKKLVAQLSQNMNFIMDLSVGEFIRLHGESRFVKDIDLVTIRILEEANKLAGERFALDTPITSLSGGQSRALMIADTAILSKSPIILIDEIENAGIDRKKSLDLLLKEDKIVLLSTHDPILALMADKRIVIKEGGIDKLIETSQEERALLGLLELLDNKSKDLRERLRQGDILKEEDICIQDVVEALKQARI